MQKLMNFPLHLPVVFMLSLLFALYMLSRAAHTSRIWLFAGIWMAITGSLAWFGFFKVTDTLPPRFLVAVLPPLLLFIYLLVSQRGRLWLSGFDLKKLTLLQTFRIPVEMVLYWLFLEKLTPELMTFQGRNLDIFSGLTAPLMYYMVFVKKQWSQQVLLGWNVLCLGLLFFTVTNGILSAPSPFQQFAFDQPNLAVLLFPFIWLPAVAVPIAYASHIISIVQLGTKQNMRKTA